MENIEQGGGFTLENKTLELPKPMSFEEFDAKQARPKDEQGNKYKPTDEDKTKVYSSYVQLFYENLKKQQAQETEVYSGYVADFYRRKQEGNSTAKGKPLDFETFMSNQRKPE